MPTPAGETLVRHARNLVRLMAHMDAEMSEYTSGARGHVRIALSDQTSEMAVQDVSKGLADIAVFSEAIHAQGLEVFPYRQDQLVVIAAPDHPLAGKRHVQFEETLEFQHVGLQPGSSLLGQLEGNAAGLGRSISFSVQVTSFDGVRRMVESGLGIAVLPDGAVTHGAAEQKLNVVPLSDAWARRALNVGVREAAALSLVARSMLAKLTKDPAHLRSGCRAPK